jgi:hypothetical protein
MNYSLGNMLSRGGALNPDGLSLDLAFAADKTLTARKGPTPTFTRASTATFVGSNGLIQSATINTPRFDHDPVTLACKGLLIEESRTNLLTQSESWQTGSSFTGPITPSISNNTTTSPDGLLTADTLSGSNGTLADGSVNSTWRLPNISSSTTYTFSIYIKSLGVATKAEIRIRDNSTGTSVQTLDTNITSDWKRISVTATTGGTTTSIRCIIQNTDGPIAIYGAQLEAGSFPTSYIPTTTTALTRSADVCSITGGDFTSLYNATEGTILANASTPASGDRTVLSIDDNTANEMTRLRTEGTNPFFKVTDGGSDVVAIDAGTVTANTTFKLAAAYEINNFAASINGGAVVADTSGTIPTVDRMRIGAGQGGNTMCGHIARIQYFRKRLPDAKLQSLTT